MSAAGRQEEGPIAVAVPVIAEVAAFRAWRSSSGGEGSVGFVPTMGALHAGHESLLRRARAENDRVVLSVFVNPTQFNDTSDLAKYPRTLAADVALAAPYVDAVFAPEPAALYPDHYRYRVTENDLSTRLEGAHQALQQPGAEGVEPLDRRHVDGDALDGRVAAAEAVDLRFQRPRVGRGPDAGAGERQPVALQVFAQELTVLHRTAPAPRVNDIRAIPSPGQSIRGDFGRFRV